MKKINPEDMRLDILPAAGKRAFLYCVEKAVFLRRGPWYLAGRTALALHEGHRQSVDLDFFLPRHGFQEERLERQLLSTKHWCTSFRQEGTLYGKLFGAKLSFIAYPFFVPSSERVYCGNVRVLTPHDIAVMKIIAISQRGRKRDFVDLYWYCTRKEALVNVIERVQRQYPGQRHNMNHILRSLTYFYDAEEDPMPMLFFQVSWNEIKKYFQHEVPKVAKEILRLP